MGRHSPVVDRQEHDVVSTLGTEPQSGSGRIVVGVDGSSHSEEALRWALGQARLTGQPVDAVISWRIPAVGGDGVGVLIDRKSTRLNSSHANISYADFCFEKNYDYAHHPKEIYQ